MVEGEKAGEQLRRGCRGIIAAGKARSRPAAHPEPPAGHQQGGDKEEGCRDENKAATQCRSAICTALLCGGVLEPEEGDEEQECGDGGLFGEKRGRRRNGGSRQLNACTGTVVLSGIDHTGRNRLADLLGMRTYILRHYGKSLFID